MQIEKVLNKEKKEEIEKIIEKNYGISPDLSKYIIFLTAKEKIWISTREAFELIKEKAGEKLNINSIGLYMGKIKRNNKIHLSLEAMHLFLKNVNKNVVMVDEKNMIRYMQGSDIIEFEKINCELNNFVLVKYKDDFIGAGVLREDRVENLLPKSRRIYESTMRQ
ncbi:MAG: hypothetical protein QXQ18_02720 [Candidatus Aenigmatarchaeota archaeon]